MTVINSQLYNFFKEADLNYIDYSDDHAKLYEKPVMLIERAEKSDETEEVWRTKQMLPGKKIYQLGVTVPSLHPIKQ